MNQARSFGPDTCKGFNGVSDQQAVRDFLSSAEAYTDGTRQVEVIETHGALIFLGTRDVYKVKRAVKYDYMDFSTLQRRLEVCNRELEFNKLLAPSIYRDVVAITQDPDGTLSINGRGEIVEWAVHMNRFPEEDVLERIAERNEIAVDLSATLGRQIASYHRDLKEVETNDGAPRIREIIDELTDAFADDSLAIPHHLAAEFKSRATAVFEALSEHLDKRAASGFVRRCHGDLHLRNIVMIDGVPTPFDALEFDERLATTDILYDVAFLIMDMLHRGLRHQANVVFNRYIYFSWSLVQAHGFEVLPLFLAIRAAIRAMVSAQAALKDRATAPSLLRDSEDYLLEALQFLQPAEPKLVAIGGLSGTGKSTLSTKLAPEVGDGQGAFLLRSDLERKKMFGAQEFERLPPEAYNEIANRHVYERIFDKARIALMQGQSVILDAVFAEPKNRQRAAEIACQLKIPFCGLWLNAPPDTLVERVRNRRQDASDADVEVVRKQLTRDGGFDQDAYDHWMEVDASGSPNNTKKNAELQMRYAFQNA